MFIKKLVSLAYVEHEDYAKVPVCQYNFSRTDWQADNERGSTI